MAVQQFKYTQKKMTQELGISKESIGKMSMEQRGKLVEIIDYIRSTNKKMSLRELKDFIYNVDLTEELQDVIWESYVLRKGILQERRDIFYNLLFQPHTHIPDKYEAKNNTRYSQLEN